MICLIIIWAVCVIFFNHLLPEYYKHFFLILIVLVYCWKRFKDGDWKYWYREKIGYYKKK